MTLVERDQWQKAIQPFAPSAFENASSNECLCLISPSDFLRLAAPIAARIPSRERTAAIREALNQNIPLDAIPALELSVDGTAASVTRHDGRHRAKELAQRGFALMPVLLTFDGCDPADLAHALKLYPEPHDEDEAYPGHDEDSLGDRLAPLDMSCIILQQDALLTATTA